MGLTSSDFKKNYSRGKGGHLPPLKTKKILTAFVFFVGLGFELRVSHLQSRHFIT
jgi:hypothetical protein